MEAKYPVLVAAGILFFLLGWYEPDCMGGADECSHASLDEVVFHLTEREVESKHAIVTMVCKTHNSTWDYPSGLGSETAVIVHGEMLRNMQNDDIDTVLLLATHGPCMGLEHWELGKYVDGLYDRVITLTGDTKLEQLVYGWKHQVHLWLKLLSINMTEYEKVVWLGYDTLAFRELNKAFVDCHGACMSRRGNADFMVFPTDQTEMDRLYKILKDGGPSSYDGVSSYDSAFMKKNYRFSMGPISWGEYSIIHFTLHSKPWFQVYCQSLPEGHILPAGPSVSKNFLGPKKGVNEKTWWCQPRPIVNLWQYVFWKVLFSTISVEDALKTKEQLGFKDSFLDDFPGAAACSNAVKDLTNAPRLPGEPDGTLISKWCT
mmetsp:Transcript_2066/g.3133  ORF Transcript_2066/g.3133 Transcript_2066/m.3133 type:complete len:374 (-) Transcript_2066:90-1211(-)|eukprot:jgi/Bigna1/68742/fgenesh1_pg.7_\